MIKKLQALIHVLSLSRIPQCETGTQLRALCVETHTSGPTREYDVMMSSPCFVLQRQHNFDDSS